MRWLCHPTAGGLALPAVLAVLAIVLASGCERRDVGHPAQSPGQVVARLNGQPLYKDDLDAYVPGEEGGVTAEVRKLRFDHWVATELLYDEASRTGIEDSEDIRRKIEQYRKDLVADQFVENILSARAIVTQKEVKDYYDAHKDEYNLEFRVSHILTNTLEDAREARQMLATKPFSWVVRKMSVDKHTGAGGDLGYLSKGNMLPAFEPVVFKMHVGEVSDIIETEFGYHILKLTDIRQSVHELPFETVAPDISRQLLMQKRIAIYDSLVTALRSHAKIEIVDPELQAVMDTADSLKTARALEAARPAAPFGQAVPEPGGADTTSADSDD